MVTIKRLRHVRVLGAESFTNNGLKVGKEAKRKSGKRKSVRNHQVSSEERDVKEKYTFPEVRKRVKREEKGD